MPEALILIGGGGHCRSCVEVLETSGYTITGIIDNNPVAIYDYTFLGTDSEINKFTGKARFLVTVGQVKNPAVRVMLYNKIKESGGQLATVIASSAIVSKHSTIGEGTVVMNHSIVNAGSIIGINCIINNKALIEHDCVINDHSHISTAAVINGGCHVGSRVFIGSNSVLANGIVITDDVVIGAGSVVVSNITEPGTYAGNPARKIK